MSDDVARIKARINVQYREARTLKVRDPERALLLLLEIAAQLDTIDQETEGYIRDRKHLMTDLFEAKAYHKAYLKARDFGLGTGRRIERIFGPQSEEAYEFGQSLAEQLFDSELYEDALGVDDYILQRAGNQTFSEKRTILIRHRMARCLEKLGKYTMAIDYHEENVEAWRRIGRYAKESSTLIYMANDLRRILSPDKAQKMEDRARKMSSVFMTYVYIPSSSMNEKAREGLAAESSNRFNDAVAAFQAAQDEVLKSNLKGETREDILEMCSVWLDFCQRKGENDFDVEDEDVSFKKTSTSPNYPDSGLAPGFYQPLDVQTIRKKTNMVNDVETRGLQRQTESPLPFSTEARPSTASIVEGVQVHSEEILTKSRPPITQAATFPCTSIGSQKPKQATPSAEFDQSTHKTNKGSILVKSRQTKLLATLLST